jgi:hypothetical protein
MPVLLPCNSLMHLDGARLHAHDTELPIATCRSVELLLLLLLLLVGPIQKQDFALRPD